MARGQEIFVVAFLLCLYYSKLVAIAADCSAFLSFCYHVLFLYVYLFWFWYVNYFAFVIANCYFAFCYCQLIFFFLLLQIDFRFVMVNCFASYFISDVVHCVVASCFTFRYCQLFCQLFCIVSLPIASMQAGADITMCVYRTL